VFVSFKSREAPERVAPLESDIEPVKVPLPDWA
jgi:hypothetical protein